MGTQEITIKDLSNCQGHMYQSMLMAFYSDFNTLKNKELRVGQAFYNYYHGIIYKSPKPSLFYETKMPEAMKIIERDLIEFVVEKCK